MKLNKNSEFKNFNCDQTISMKLDLNNAHSIMNLLRNSIYSDPISSFVREVLSNAMDAHIRADKLLAPIEVSLDREVDSLYLCVRDFGHSMNKEKIENVYSVMGKSDKGEDNTEIGMWGLGAASPLSYSTFFYVETWTLEARSGVAAHAAKAFVRPVELIEQEARKSVAGVPPVELIEQEARKSVAGVPPVELIEQEDNLSIYRKWAQYIDISRIGAISLLKEEAEPAKTGSFGTKISIPIKNEDLDKVVNAVSFYAAYSQIEIKAMNFVLNKIKKKNNSKYALIGNNYELNLNTTNSNELKDKQGIVVIGSIPYFIDQRILFSHFNSEMLNLLQPSSSFHQEKLEYFIDFIKCFQYFEWRLNCPIGSIDISASREDVQYTPKTIKFLWLLFYEVYVDVCEIIKCCLIYNNDFIAACKYYSVINYNFKGIFGDIYWAKESIKFINNPSIFKSYLIDSTCYYLANDINNNELKIRTQKLKTFNIYYHVPVFIIQDTKYKLYNKFINYYIIQSEKELSSTRNHYFLIEDDSLKEMHDWVKNTYKFIKLSDLVTEYKQNHKTNKPKNSLNPKDDNEFKSYRYEGSVVRNRIQGFGMFFEGKVKALKAPDCIQYYLNEETIIDNKNIVDWTRFESSRSFLLSDYLRRKNISRYNLYYTKSYNSNFAHENWLDLTEVIKKDLELYKNSEEQLFNDFLLTKLIETEYESFIKINDLLKEGKYFCNMNTKGRFNFELEKYNQSKNRINSFELNLYLMTNQSYRNIEEMNSCYYKNIKANDVNLYGRQSIFTKLIEYYTDYFDDYPLLRFLNKKDNIKAHQIEDFVTYINLLESSRKEDSYN